MEETVGAILRAQREALHLTIEDVANQTSFRVEQIEKLEEDDFTVFKTAIYAKGAIRGYGNFLGLDGLELVKQFKANQLAGARFADNLSNKEALDAVTKSKVKMNLISQPGVGTQTSFSKDSSPLPFRQIFFGIILILVLIGAFSLTPGVKLDKPEITVFDDISAKVKGMYDTLTNLVSESHEAEPVKAAPENKNVPETVKEASTQVPVKVKDDNAIAARYDKVVVEMTATGQCWIDVFADGKAIYSGMMTNGRYKIFEANKRITVRYGNIGVIQVIVNGKPVNMRGEAGVATRHYPK